MNSRLAEQLAGRYVRAHDRLSDALTGGRAVLLLAAAFAALVVFNVGRARGWWG